MSSRGGGFPFPIRLGISLAAGGIFLLFVLLVLSYSFGLSLLIGAVLAFIVYILLGMAGDPPGYSNAQGQTSATNHVGAAGAPGSGSTSGPGSTSGSGSTMASSAGAASLGAKTDDEAGAELSTSGSGAGSSDSLEEAMDSSGSAGSAAVASASRPDSIKPSAYLEGENELAERKGDWSYDGNAGSDSTVEKTEKKGAESAAAPKAKGSAKVKTESKSKSDAPAKSKKPKPAPAADDVDYDGDGIIEGTNEGQRPEALDGPRGGTADNLKEIKGIGPKLEKLCNSLGFYHFDQIAGWSADEVAWVNANLQGFKGRVTRDTWVEQAKILAAGGETEFSKRVDKGGVY